MLKRKSKVAKRSTSVKQREADRSLIELKAFKNDCIIVGKKVDEGEKIRRVETLKDGKDLFLKRQTADKLTHKSFKTVSRIMIDATGQMEMQNPTQLVLEKN